MKAEGIMFIINNCLLCMNNNIFTITNKRNPLGMLNWMEEELRKTEELSKPVYWSVTYLSEQKSSLISATCVTRSCLIGSAT